MKLEKIKAELAKLLIKFESVKTDNGVLEYEGELAEGTKVFVMDVETEERIPATDGEYVLEDGRTLVVANGTITEIKEAVEEEVVEEPEVTEEPTEELAEPEVTEEEVTEPEVVEEPKEEETVEPTEIEKKITELEDKVAELAEAVKKLIDETAEKMKDVEEKFSKISLAKPAVEEFEQAKEVKKTGNTKVDKFMEKFGNK